jgi:recombination protein RecA
MFVEWSADMLKSMLAKNLFACIALDSTSAMVSKAEYEIKERKGEEQQTVAYTARAMASLLRQIVGSGLLSRSDASVFFMSQLRDNFFGRGFRGQPPPDKATGGRALRFYASTQVEVIRGDIFKADVQNDAGYIEKDQEVGHETKVRIRKNKNNAKQGRVAAFDVYSEGEIAGLDRIAEVIKLAILVGVIERKSSWFQFGSVRVQGEEPFKAAITADSNLCATLIQQTRIALDVAMTASALVPIPIEALEQDDDSVLDRLEAVDGIT